MAYKLSEIEEHDALKYFDEFKGDLLQIVQHVFSDIAEKGSTVRGRALRKFLVEDRGLVYHAKKGPANRQYKLSEEEKLFLKNNYNNSLTKKEVAALLWPTESQKMVGFQRSEKYIALVEYINAAYPDIDSIDNAEGTLYIPPRVTNTVVKLINKVTRSNLEIERLTTFHKTCIDRLFSFLNAPRFVQQINSYSKQDSRVLFESEFVRAVWNKPDLTADEINLYINICIDYINLQQVERQRQKLNRLFDEADETKDLHIRLSEMLKQKADEYDKAAGRIDKLISKLNVDRKNRLSAREKSTASVLALVETFQDETERKRMIAVSELKAKRVKDEVESFENMESWKARVLGIGSEDIYQ